MLRISVVALLLAIATVGVFSASIDAVLAKGTPDVLGIRAGMTYNEVRAALNAHRPDLVVRELAGTSASPQSRLDMSASARRLPREKFLIDFSQPPEGRVYQVWRHIGYPSGTRPLQVDLARSLVAKYGEPTAQSAPAAFKVRLAWVFTDQRKGNAIRETLEACAGEVGTGRWGNHPECGTVIVAEISLSRESSSEVSAVTMALLDHKRWKEHLVTAPPGDVFSGLKR